MIDFVIYACATLIQFVVVIVFARIARIQRSIINDQSATIFRLEKSMRAIRLALDLRETRTGEKIEVPE